MLNPGIQRVFHGRQALGLVSDIGSADRPRVGDVQAHLADLNTFFFKLGQGRMGQNQG